MRGCRGMVSCHRAQRTDGKKQIQAEDNFWLRWNLSILHKKENIPSCMKMWCSHMEVQDFHVAQMVKNLPAMQETRVQPLGQEDPLEKGMASHSSILAWRIPWAEEPSGLQSVELQRVRHDWVTNTWEYASSHRGGGMLLITQLLIWAVGMYSILMTRTNAKPHSDLRTKRLEILFSWPYTMKSNSHCLGWGVGMTHHSEEQASVVLWWKMFLSGKLNGQNLYTSDLRGGNTKVCTYIRPDVHDQGHVRSCQILAQIIAIQIYVLKSSYPTWYSAPSPYMKKRTSTCCYKILNVLNGSQWLNCFNFYKCWKLLKFIVSTL